MNELATLNRLLRQAVLTEIASACASLLDQKVDIEGRTRTKNMKRASRKASSASRRRSWP